MKMHNLAGLLTLPALFFSRLNEDAQFSRTPDTASSVL